MKKTTENAKGSLTPLEKKLADALYRTWAAMPGDLSCLALDEAYTTPERHEEAVNEISDPAFEALDEARAAGWTEPKD